LRLTSHGRGVLHLWCYRSAIGFKPRDATFAVCQATPSEYFQETGDMIKGAQGKALNLVAVALLLSAGPVFGQGGGKAEPKRIEFKPGTTSTVINDKVRGTEEAEYVFSAKKGQKLIVHLTSTPRKSSVFDLKAPNNADLGLEYDANYDYTGTLPETGDYMIIVARPTTSPGTSTYRLSITVR
jgi:hypothetical protein